MKTRNKLLKKGMLVQWITQPQNQGGPSETDRVGVGIVLDEWASPVDEWVSPAQSTYPVDRSDAVEYFVCIYWTKSQQVGKYWDDRHMDYALKVIHEN